MLVSEMCGAASAACEGRDEHVAVFTACEGPSLTNPEESAASWEQAWIDLGGEG